MACLILTGPVAAGKNTIGKVIAQTWPKGVLIDVDQLRWMILSPHRAPWRGSEGHAQQLLGVSNACMLAKKFISEGFSVVVCDVLTDESAEIYRQELPLASKIIKLSPSLAVAKQRDTSRGPQLTDEEFATLFEQQHSFSDYDFDIDNSELEPLAVAKEILLYAS